MSDVWMWLFFAFLLCVCCLVLFSLFKAKQVEKQLGASGKFIEVNGHRIHYTDEGKGRPILFIHGLYGSGRNFTCRLTKLLTPNYRVIVMDRPGAGHSTRSLSAPANFYAQAGDVAAFIEKMKLDKPLIAGHSMGGAISLALALNFSHLTGGLVLIAPLTKALAKPPRAFAKLEIRSRIARFITAWTLAIPVAMLRSREQIEMIFHPDPVPEIFAVEGGGLLSFRPSNFYSASTDLVETNVDLVNMTSRYGELKLPMAMVFGTEDNILEYEKHGQSFSREFPEVKFFPLEGRGHMLPVTAPEEVAKAIIAMREETKG